MILQCRRDVGIDGGQRRPKSRSKRPSVGEEDQVQCPKCGGNLQGVVQDNIEVDRCDRCGGLWFDRLEADRLLRARGSDAVDVGDAKMGEQQNVKGKIECPRCHTQMIRMVDLDQHHIWYESCPVCYGKWFDAGEFADLKHDTVVDFFRDLFARERK